jgi:hypothetical protein
MLFFFAGLGFTLADEVRYLVATLIRHSAGVDGLQLLASSVVVWISTVLLVAIKAYQLSSLSGSGLVVGDYTHPH